MLGERPARNCYGAQVPVVPVVTAHVLIPLWFAASFTVSVTLKLPGANRWLEVEPLPVAPSPYAQAYDEMPWSSVEVVPSKLQFLPFLPTQLHVYRATGGASTAGAPLVVADAVFENADDPTPFFASTRYEYVVLAASPVSE